MLTVAYCLAYNQRSKCLFFAILACFATCFLDRKPRYYPTWKTSFVRFCLTTILLLFLIPASYSQNTKGDRPSVKGGAKRENRFRSSSKKKSKGKQSYNRLQGRRTTQANRASSSKPTKVYSQKGRFVNNRSVTNKIFKQNARSRARVNSQSVSSQQAKRNSSSPRVQARSATGTTRNVYPQRGRYVNHSSRKPTDQAVSNRQQVARTKKYGHQPDPPKKRRVKPASASRSYISRRSINAFAGFWNRKPKGEKAYVGDIAGKKLRTKNFETKRVVITNPTANPYKPKKRIGDKPYKGSMMGGYATATRSGNAWRGDIAGRKIRGRNFSSKENTENRGRSIFPPKKSKSRIGDRPYKGTIPGGGYQSVSGKRKKGNNPIPGKTPGIGANGIDTFSGTIKGRKTFSSQGEGYAGNIKGQRPLKGGGSVSGKAWNNKQRAIPGKSPKGGWEMGAYQGNIKGRKTFSPQGEGYAGNIKTQKPLKGGGSVSGKAWNNQQRPISGKSPKIVGYDVFQGNIKGKKTFSPQGEEYSGNIKAQKPVKGGGSMSGKTWNNKQHAIAGKSPKGGLEMGTYQGNIKAGKPLKGGGSVSGKLWNNKETPIAGKAPKGVSGYDTFQGTTKVSKKEPSKEVGGFPGKYNEFDLHPSMQNQGEQFTGFIRLPRFKKHYIKNPNAAEASLKKTRPDKSTYEVDGLQIKVKQKDYAKRPNAAEGAMLGIAPGKNSTKASEFTRVMRQNWNYKHNPNSADESLDAHEPSKAFGKSTSYQGNIKMKKFEFFGKKELHPDSKFVKTNKNNTDEERSVLTSFKLWWARVFKKSETLPDHLKEKYRKPRYDKGEQGLWAD